MVRAEISGYEEQIIVDFVGNGASLLISLLNMSDKKK